MDKEGLQYLAQMAGAGSCIDFDEPAAALAEGMALVDLEKFQEMPRRMRAHFQTTRLSDLLAYAKPEMDRSSAVFIDPDGSGVEIIVDYGSGAMPEWNTHKATMSCTPTPEYKALLDLVSRGCSQRDITDWLEDWHEVIEACDSDGQTIGNSKAVAAIRRVDIKIGRQSTHTDGDMAASRNTLDSISASSGDGALPAFFRLHTTLFEDMEQRQVRVRLSLRTSDDTPKFGLRVIAQDQLKREITQELEARVRKELDQSRVFVGSV